MSLASRISDLAGAIRDKLNTMTPLLPPPGGATGQALLKASGADGDAAWAASFRGLALPFRPAAGLFVSAATSGGALGTIAQTANRNTIAPFVSAHDLTIDLVAISVSTVIAGSLSKVVIYGSNANGGPDTALAESADIPCSNLGHQTAALSFTFEAGRVYWIGVRSSATQTLRSLTAPAFPVLTYTSAATPVIQGALVKTETYANAAGAWGYVAAHHSNLTVPLVSMRVA